MVTSTCAAECISASSSVHQILWLLTILHELGDPQANPTTLRIDNTVAVAVVKATAQARRSKFIDIKYHHIQDNILQGFIETKYWPSGSMIAEPLTKSISISKYQQHKSSIKVVPYRPQNMPMAVRVS